MEKMDNKTDRYFRDRLGNYEQSPPDAAWESIVAKIEGRKKKRAMLIFFRIAAGMALLISAGMGIYYISTKGGSHSDIAAGRTEPLTNQYATTKNSEDAVSEKQVSTGVTNENTGIAGRSDEPDVKEKRSAGVLVAIHGDSFYTDENNEADETNEPFEQIVEQPLQDPDQIAVHENLPGENAVAPVIPTQAADTSMTPEQAAAVLLAMNADEEEPAEKVRRWTIGSEIAPLYSNRSINSEAAYNNTVSNLNSSETGILAYAGGIRVAVNAGKRLTVQSGIYYSRYGQQINEVQTVAGTEVSSESYRFIAASNSTGKIEGVISAQSQAGLSLDDYDKAGMFYSSDIRNGITNSELKPLVEGDAQDIQLKQYFDYFELPLILRYKVIDRKLDFSFSGGLITNFMVGNTVNLVADGDSKQIGETTGINEINYLGSFGLGMEMPLAGNFSISLEPRFRYYINSIDRSEIISVHPYSFGFFAGVNYRF